MSLPSSRRRFENFLKTNSASRRTKKDKKLKERKFRTFEDAATRRSAKRNEDGASSNPDLQSSKEFWTERNLLPRISSSTNLSVFIADYCMQQEEEQSSC